MDREWNSGQSPDCPGCGVEVGAAHDETCVQARCPECGAQLLGHVEHESARPAVWHGVDVQTDVARQLGWWLEHEDGSRFEDQARVREGIQRGYVVWDREAQRYRQAERITAVELPRVLLKEALWTGCRGRYVEEAGVHLLVDTGLWVDRTDFRAAYVDYERDEEPRRGSGAARVRWTQVAEDLDAGRLLGSSGDVAVLRLAASMAGGVPVDLGAALLAVRRMRVAPAVVAALETAVT